jgi:energy-coupling factor transporter ATP-binding protein EcfA2
MAARKVSFARGTKPWSARLEHFRAYTVAHPRLIEARDQLMDAIRDSEPNTLVLVFGPTGVGKTTLRLKAEQTLVDEFRTDADVDRERIPLVSAEAVAPESGNFSWSDHFKRLLRQMNEPLVEHKQRRPVMSGTEEPFQAGPRTRTEDYRYALEQALLYRRPTAVMIDEAQHMAKMASGRRLLDQLDVIKSIANRTGTVHVLFGTYDLLAFRNRGGQVSRRSVDLHFPRYRAEDTSDRRVFLNVLHSFRQQLPLPEEFDLVSHWEYLYERSVGCVGVLKQWLVKALCGALRAGRSGLTLRDLERTGLSVAQCEKMLSEAAEGEARFAGNPSSRAQLRGRLGLPSESAQRAPLGMQVGRERAPSGKNTHPGRRKPTRDVVGDGGASHNAVA